MKTNRFFSRAILATFLIAVISVTSTMAQPQKDTFETSDGPLEVNFVGHASLYFSFNGDVIHVDPYGEMGDYQIMPKADLILITHAHADHLDENTIQDISQENTSLVVNEASHQELGKGKVLKNGDKTEVAGYTIRAVPAYNIEHKRENGEPYHPKGRDNGYLIEFGDKTVYIGGDTENIPEMKNLPDIDIAFLPMNLPYTMSPEMAKDAALMFEPDVLYPYHYQMGETDTDKFKQLMADVPGIEVRFRD
ncbi:MAG: MBL fold metallo-hydrolase [Bacteroidota bacterium]